MTISYPKKRVTVRHCNKHWNALSAKLLLTDQNLPIIHKQPPGKGYRHYLAKKEIIQFINILPEWNELSKGITNIELVEGLEGSDGWYTGSTVAINAWERDPWRVVPVEYYLQHMNLLKKLNVNCVKQGGQYLCQFEDYSVKAFQLLHILLHELGHHHDKMTTKRQMESSRGEIYAEAYAMNYASIIWNRYFEIARN